MSKSSTGQIRLHTEEPSVPAWSSAIFYTNFYYSLDMVSFPVVSVQQLEKQKLVSWDSSDCLWKLVHQNVWRLLEMESVRLVWKSDVMGIVAVFPSSSGMEFCWHPPLSEWGGGQNPQKKEEETERERVVSTLSTIPKIFCSPRQHLFDQNYSKNNKYREILLQYKIDVFYWNIFDSKLNVQHHTPVYSVTWSFRNHFWKVSGNVPPPCNPIYMENWPCQCVLPY